MSASVTVLRYLAGRRDTREPPKIPYIAAFGEGRTCPGTRSSDWTWRVSLDCLWVGALVAGCDGRRRTEKVFYEVFRILLTITNITIVITIDYNAVDKGFAGKFSGTQWSRTIEAPFMVNLKEKE
jgi:hypothetical protein